MTNNRISHKKYLCTLIGFIVSLVACQQGNNSRIDVPTPLPTFALTATSVSLPTAVPTETTATLTTAVPAATVTATAVSPPPTSNTVQPTRIQFASGAISSSQTGTIQPFVPQEYLLYALAGQMMHISLNSSTGKVNFALQGVTDGQPYKRVENEERFWNGNLPSSQDYLIRVITADPAETYTLDVTIDPLPTAPQRIQFAPGAISASVSGTIEANTTDPYILSAQAGQTMHVFLTATNGQANFDLVGKSDGVPYKRAIYLPASWEGFLPMTQDYLINVSAPANTADSYALSVTIDPIMSEPAPQRIQFAAGAISAVVNGSMAAGGDGRSYILNAGAGQNLTVQVSSNAPGAITIFIKDNTDRIWLSGTDEETLSINLPQTADYTIFLFSAGAAPAINYTMTITIP